jgi:hypothetical protein
MKKLVKRTGLTVLTVTALGFLCFCGFRASEHIEGNNYLTYLKKNTETVSLEQSFRFDLMQQDLTKHRLILVGEIHGFQEPNKFDLELFTHLITNHEVKTYLAEMDFCQAYYLNNYNRTGDSKLLKEILKEWEVTIGRDNKDYAEKWMNLRKVYQDGYEFKYIGNNNLSDIKLLGRWLHEKTGNREFLQSPQNDSLAVIQFLNLAKQELGEITTDETIWEINHQIRNMERYLNKAYREEVITENLLELYEHYGLYNQKVYGFYGLGHTMQSPIQEGFESMASRLKQQDSRFKDALLSINIVFTDSYMTVRSKGLPKFLRDQGPFTRMPVSYDNIWLNYLHGIEDLKRICLPYTKSLIKLDGTNSPYFNSRRLFRMSKILPIGQVLNAREDRSTTDYGQYLLFFRNSDWARPK